MSTYSAQQIAEILAAHREYLCGRDGRKADLSKADLSGANLSGADLSKANLSWADLSWADLSGANMRGANLSWANLRGADLQWAKLRGADLRWAKLSKANLSGADLRGADLSEANLSEANLSEANLRGATDGSIARLDFGGWSICVRATHTSIGCHCRDNSEWMSWSHDAPEISAMHRDAPTWWLVHGAAIKAVIRCVMAKAESAT